MLLAQAIRQAISVWSIRILLGVTSQDVLEGLHEVAVPMDEMQHAADVHLCEAIEHGMVDGFTAPGIAQSPADLPAASCELEVLVGARGDALIDLGQTLPDALRAQPNALGWAG